MVIDGIHHTLPFIVSEEIGHTGHSPTAATWDDNVGSILVFHSYHSQNDTKKPPALKPQQKTELLVFSQGSSPVQTTALAEERPAWERIAPCIDSAATNTCKTPSPGLGWQKFLFGRTSFSLTSLVKWRVLDEKIEEKLKTKTIS